MRTLAAPAAALLGIVGSLAAAPPSNADPEMCRGQVATIVATKNAEKLKGTPGPDVISTAGHDYVTVEAGDGADLICNPRGKAAHLYGGGGDDHIVTDGWSDVHGDDGDDVLTDQGTHPQSDEFPSEFAQLDGGTGNDTIRSINHDAMASFADSTSPVAIDLPNGTATDGTFTDQLVGIKRVAGTKFADTFTGTSGDDYYRGYGPDIVSTGDGNDDVGVAGNWNSAEPARIDTGAGDDQVRAAHATVIAGPGDDTVHIDGGGTALGGPGADDLTGIGDYEESSGVHDEFILNGGRGDDRIGLPVAFYAISPVRCPSLCAISQLSGGPGADTLDLTRWPMSQRSTMVDLAAGTASQGPGRATLAHIENVDGTRRPDIIRGDSNANHLDGNGRDDILIGRGGNDLLHGHAGRDRADGGPGRDICVAERRSSCLPPHVSTHTRTSRVT